MTKISDDEGNYVIDILVRSHDLTSFSACYFVNDYIALYCVVT